MLRSLTIAAAIAAVLALSATTAFCQQADHGTPEQAKAMLLKAEAAVKADKAKALEMFNNGEGRIPRPRPLCILRQCQRR